MYNINYKGRKQGDFMTHVSTKIRFHNGNLENV